MAGKPRAKKPARRGSEVTVKAQTSPDSFYAATIPLYESASAQASRPVTDAQMLIGRVAQLVMIYADMNARACSSIPMRLYAPARSTAAKMFRHRTFRMNEWRHKKHVNYLHDTIKGPGTKAAQYADYADDVVEIVDHPALETLRNPSPWFRGQTFRYWCHFQWQVFGRRFLLAVDNGSEGLALMPMMGHMTWVLPSSTNLIQGYAYGKNRSVEAVYQPEDVFYHRLRPSPWSLIDSTGPLHAVFNEQDIYNLATMSEIALWKNQGRPDYFIPLPADVRDPATAAKMIEEQMKAKYGGVRNRGKALVGTFGAPVPMGFPPKEMEYIGGKQDLRSVIRLAFGIPESMDQGNASTYAGAGVGDFQYRSDTVRPTINQDAEEWTETLLKEFGVEPGEMWFACDDPVPANKDAIRADADVYIRNRVMTPNEIRNELGMEPIEGGDEWYEPPQPMGFGGFGGSTEDDKEDTTESAPGEAPEKPETPEDATKAHAKGCACCKGKELATKDDRPNKPGKRDRIVMAMQMDMEQWINSIADRLEVQADGTVDLAPFERELGEIALPHVREMFGEGAVDGFAKINREVEDPFSVIPGRAIDYIRRQGALLVQRVSDTTREDIRDAISAAIQAGENVSQATGRIAEVMKTASPARAETIARTEMGVAFQEGNRQAWKASGIKAYRFSPAPDCCAFCQDFAKQYTDPIPIDQPLAKAGQTITGDGQSRVLKFDLQGATIHPNCRCDWEPVFDDEMGGAE